MVRTKLSKLKPMTLVVYSNSRRVGKNLALPVSQPRSVRSMRRRIGKLHVDVEVALVLIGQEAGR